jgi:hypothetical protein
LAVDRSISDQVVGALPNAEGSRGGSVAPVPSERWWVVQVDCFPGGFGLVVDFDGFGVEVVADQGGGEEVFDVAGRGGLVAGFADEGAGWVGDQVEAFGGGGGGGADPECGGGGLSAGFAVVVSGGAGEFEDGPVRVDPDSPVGMMFDQVMPSTEGPGIWRSVLPPCSGCRWLNSSR